MSKEDWYFPPLRFPEFSNLQGWKERKLHEVLFEHKQKSTGTEEVFSVSVHKGVINQIEHLGRSFSAANTDHYKRVLPGDVIYTKSPTGDFPYGIIKQSKVAKAVIVSPLYGVFKPETVALGYLLDSYFESVANTTNYLSSIVQKGAKNTINIHNDTFLSKGLILPDNQEEQQKIADCLSSLDDVITAQTQKLDLLKAHKKGLMQDLFPAEGESVPRLRFGEFEGEWEIECLCENNVAFFVNDRIPVSELKIETYISTENLLSDYGGVTKTAKLPSSGSFTQFKKGDILISNIRPYLKKVWIATFSGGASNDVIVVRAGAKLADSFLASILKNDDFIDYVMTGAQGVKMPRGDKSLMAKYPVAYPDRSEQQKIADCLSSLDDQIQAQTQKIERLKLHKKGLMQQLFPSIQ